MHTEIERALREVEKQEGVAVLFAAESGSRAWGFASPDSDWDVRFIYARPTLWHLRLRPGRDVIERDLPGHLDLVGWDARKALNLLLKGNCAIREWLRSPAVYRLVPEFSGRLNDMALRLPARRAALHHYAALIHQVRDRWLGRRPVALKKYLYAVRPALAVRWLRTHPDGGLPPMDMPRLMAEAGLSEEERAALEALLVAKAMVSEMGEGDPLPALDAMIEGEHSLARAMHEPPLPVPAEVAEMAERFMADAARFADGARGA